MKKVYSYELLNAEQTKKFATKLAKYLEAGNLITLDGDLGVGKTTFTQGLAIGLEINQIVNSPTFTIIKEYYGKYTLYHMDVYRLKDGFDDIGFEEYFYGEGITVVEWPSIIQEILPNNYLEIKIEKITENIRNIILIPEGEQYIQMCEEFNKYENFSN